MGVDITLIPITVEMLNGDKKELVNVLNENFNAIKNSVDEGNKYYLSKLGSIDNTLTDIKVALSYKADSEEMKKYFMLIFEKLGIASEKKVLTDSKG